MNFPNDIIKEWNIKSKSDVETGSDALRIGKTIYQAILVRSLDILNEEEEEALDTLLDNDSTTTEDVLKFLKSKIPTFDILVKEEREKIKGELVTT